MTVTYQAINACNWRSDLGGRWIPNITQNIRQGQWTQEMGINIGVMVFDLTALRNQFATHSVVRATLALTRTGSGTPGTALPLSLYAGNQVNMPARTNNVSTPAARPARVSGVFTTTISGGQGAKSVGISTALINSIGNGSSNCLFMDVDANHTNYMSFTGRDDISRIRLTIEWSPRTAVANPPTSLAVNPTISEGNTTLSWAGTVAGVNNTITGYDVEFSDSTNNSSWGAWQTLTTVNTSATSHSMAVAPPPTRGNFRRFRVRTRVAAGSGFFSGWRTSTNSVRRNIPPAAPTSAIATPDVYADETVTLAWAGAASGLSPIRGFQIASREGTGEIVPPDLNITQDFIPIGRANRPGRVNNMLYVTIHETDNTSVGANAAGHAAWLNTVGTAVSWHYTVDDTHTFQHLPEAEDAFHAGDGAGSGNRHSIGIEICVNADGNFQQAVERAILLTADICARRDIPISNVVQHHHWSGKHCPRNIREGNPFGWEVFQNKVSTALDTELVWGDWAVLATINLNATGGTFRPEVSRIPGTHTQFGVWTIDTLGTFSALTVSNSILNIPLDRPPLEPRVDAPRSGSVTYNTKPMVFIQVQPEPDGQLQQVFVRIGDGDWHNSVDNPEYFTTSGWLGANQRTVYTSDELPLGSHTVQVFTSDGHFDGPTASRNFTILASPFDTITFNQTTVKARHITDLRTAIINNRSYYHIAAYAWAEAVIPGETLVLYWPFHILELRAALGSVIDWVNNYDLEAAGKGVLPLENIIPLEWLPMGTRRPRAAVMNQLMELALTV